MKILVICQYYAPEPFRVTDICRALVQNGHDVTVVTGVPNYPMGKVYDGYHKGQKRDELLDGVRVHRCFTIARRSGPIWRLLNYYSFAISSSRYIAGLEDYYDVVFVYQLSPVMMANAGIRYKKKHGTKLVLYCLDLWPESLAAGGIRRGSLLYRWFHRVSEKIYRAADRILISSRFFANYFSEEFGIENTQYLPQHAEAIFTPESCKKQPDEIIDLMFAGNIGAAQSVQTIIRAAARTKDIANLRWHIVGDGSELENCKQLAVELNVENMIFHGRKTAREMPTYYTMADAMLVTLEKNPILSLTLPGKVQSYMAAGKAIIGAIDGEVAEVIQQAGCGLCCSSEDDAALADAVRNFVSNPAKETYCQNARKYYDANFTMKRYLSRLEMELKD